MIYLRDYSVWLLGKLRAIMRPTGYMDYLEAPSPFKFIAFEQSKSFIISMIHERVPYTDLRLMSTGSRYSRTIYISTFCIALYADRK
jgi:hypothetical protein